jgi:hypothetical protein
MYKQNLLRLTLSYASLKYRAASSMAPPNRGPIVSKPVSEDHDSVFFLVMLSQKPLPSIIV